MKGFPRPVVADRLDLRDRVYQPRVADPPGPGADARRRFRFPVLDQRRSQACTGFALANVVNYLLAAAGRKGEEPVSPWMLYSMARRYDEFPGARDVGSSLRGVMKGWFKHGVCAAPFWSREPMPPPQRDAAKDWWPNAARRPLGAYYRVDARSVSDMHVALNEVGVICASAAAHDGWDKPAGARGGWRIPPRKASPTDGGHAFVIIGYDEHGFLVLNSWGPGWADHGVATLTYDDWLDNAMDCWVAQLGVVTDQHREVAAAPTLRRSPAGTVTLAAETTLRNRELTAFVIDMENNGALSQSGEFRTQASDLAALVGNHLATARRRWNLGSGEAADVAIYAHGGLTSESEAADTAATWVPALYDARIFPIFLMWESDFFATLKNRLEDLFKGVPRPTGGLWDRMLDSASRWWNARLEQSLASPGSEVWGEMKQNADAMTGNPESGACRLFALGGGVPAWTPGLVRLHLVGHSAGAILLTHLAAWLAARGWPIDTVHFMAPAARVDLFKATLMPLLRDRRVGRYVQFHLTDDVEQKDTTCRAIFGYGRSLLYLVSESFEHGVRTPILGMERYLDDWRADAPAGVVTLNASPGPASGASTHGGFAADALTLRTVIGGIAASRGAGPIGRRGGGRPRPRR
ncbi:MAG: C1 family peptidase [Candidatus Rokuibacteriota bacterium]